VGSGWGLVELHERYALLKFAIESSQFVSV